MDTPHTTTPSTEPPPGSSKSRLIFRTSDPGIQEDESLRWLTERLRQRRLARQAAAQSPPLPPLPSPS